jgi:hypothetical protein
MTIPVDPPIPANPDPHTAATIDTSDLAAPLHAD